MLDRCNAAVKHSFGSTAPSYRKLSNYHFFLFEIGHALLLDRYSAVVAFIMSSGALVIPICPDYSFFFSIRGLC